MTVKGRKALQSDNEMLYEHNKAMSEEVQRLSGEVKLRQERLSTVLLDLETLLSIPFLKSLRRLISMRKEYRDALNRKSQSG